MKDTLAFHILYLYKNFLDYVNENLKAHDFCRGQMPFILYVGKHEDCTPSDVTRSLKMDWGHSQRSITKLVEQNLIEKVYGKENGRRYHLRLTEKGQEIFQLCHDLFHDWDAECLSFLPEEEREQLTAELHQLTDKLERR